MEKVWKVWGVALGFGRKLRLASCEPHSDKFNRWMMGLWTLSLTMAGVNLAMNLAMINRPLSWLWLTINCLTAAFDGMMLYFCVQGFFYRREERRKEAEFHQFVEIVVNGYTR